MKFSLDTNACIQHLRAARRSVESPIGARLSTIDQDDVVICSVVRHELIFGALKCDLPERELAAVDLFVTGFPTAAFDDEAARVCAEIRLVLESAGEKIEAFDLQIASIAIANGLILVTHNTKHFSRIPGLQLDDWQ